MYGKKCTKTASSLLTFVSFVVLSSVAFAETPKQNGTFPDVTTWGDMPIHTNYEGAVAHLTKLKHPFEAKIFTKTGAKYLVLKSCSPMGPTRESGGLCGTKEGSSSWKVTVYFRQTDELLTEVLVQGPKFNSRGDLERTRDSFLATFGPSHSGGGGGHSGKVTTVSVWQNKLVELQVETTFWTKSRQYDLWFRWGPVRLPPEESGSGPSVDGARINAPPELPVRKTK